MQVDMCTVSPSFSLSILIPKQMNETLGEVAAPAEEIVPTCEFEITDIVAFRQQYITKALILGEQTGREIVLELSRLEVEADIMAGRFEKPASEPARLGGRRCDTDHAGIPLVRAGLGQDITNHTRVS